MTAVCYPSVVSNTAYGEPRVHVNNLNIIFKSKLRDLRTRVQKAAL